MSDYSKKTDAELKNYIEYREEEVRKQGAKLRIFGKVLGEDKIDNIMDMVQAMQDDVNTYKWYMSELNDMYDELKRRQEEDEDVQ